MSVVSNQHDNPNYGEASDWDDQIADWQVEAEQLDSDTCPCGKPKERGEYICDACADLEEQEEARDHEEEERQERLLKALPNGDYTASEMQEYLS